MSILARLVVIAVALTASVHGQSMPATVFMDLTPGLGTLTPQYTIGGASFNVDTATKRHGYASIRAHGGSSQLLSPWGVMADAGRRLVFAFNPDSLAEATVLAIGGVTNVVTVSLNTDGTLDLNALCAGVQTTTQAVPAQEWTQLTVAYVIDSPSVFTVNLYIGGSTVPAASVSSGTLCNVATAQFRFLVFTGSGLSYRIQDIYVDDGDDAGNPSAGADLFVTTKRPIANGAANQYTTYGTPSGTGSGHASWVNERPWSGDNYLDQTSSGQRDEDYAIEGVADGDDDLTGALILASQTWQIARLTGKGSTPIVSQFSDGSALPFTPASVFGLTAAPFLPGVYPGVAPMVGQRSSKGSGKIPALAAAGVGIAYLR